MKGLTVLALTLIALAGWGATQAWGLQVYLQPRFPTAPIGVTFAESINVRNNTFFLYSWQVEFLWDPAVLKCTSVQEGTFLSQNGTTFWVPPPDTSNSGNWVFGSTLIGGGVYAHQPTGTLATMTFKCLSAGSCSLRFDPANTFLLDTNIAVVPDTLQNGFFTATNGVEENPGVGGQRSEVGIRPAPNPFVSFAAVPGHEAERFELFDISGRKVGTYRGNRIGEGLKPGVYFLRRESRVGIVSRLVKLH